MYSFLKKILKNNWFISIFIAILTVILGLLAKIYEPQIAQILTGKKGPSPTIHYFFSEPEQIVTGKSVKLKWKCESANWCNLEWDDKIIDKRPTEFFWEVFPKKTTKYKLFAISENGETATRETTVIVHQSNATKKGKIREYVSVHEIMRDLDCDIKNLNNGLKEILFLKNYRGKRVKLTKTVSKIDLKKSNIFLSKDEEEGLATIPGTDGVGIVLIRFNEPVIIRTEFQGNLFNLIREGDKVMFDCQISDFCKDGLLFDKELIFDDCKLENEFYLERPN